MVSSWDSRSAAEEQDCMPYYFELYLLDFSLGKQDGCRDLEHIVILIKEFNDILFSLLMLGQTEGLKEMCALDGGTKPSLNIREAVFRE